MVTAEAIQTFMSQKNIAVAGISREKKKFGNAIYRELSSKGYNLFPLHPEMQEYDGKVCYKAIADLPAEVTGLIINTKPDVTKELINSAKEKGIKNIWLQQGSADNETIKSLGNSELNIISKQCVIMFAEPVKGFHSFHRFMKKTFGKFPK